MKARTKHRSVKEKFNGRMYLSQVSKNVIFSILLKLIQQYEQDSAKRFGLNLRYRFEFFVRTTTRQKKNMTNKNRIQNQTAVVTGATSGIGQACAFALAEQGVNLILMARRAERLAALKDELSKYPVTVETYVLDVRELDKVNEVFADVYAKHKVDILINNAGLALGLGNIDEGRIEQWEQMIDTNIKGLLYVSRAVIPKMRAQNSGHIINIGSMAGGITYPGGNVYCASKSAVHTLSEAMNLDLVGTNIRVSNVAPGAANTEFSKVRFDGNETQADAVYEGFTPLGAEDIADLIVYILNAPAHVNIQHTLVMPTAQRSPTVLHRDQ